MPNSGFLGYLASPIPGILDSLKVLQGPGERYYLGRSEVSRDHLPLLGKTVLRTESKKRENTGECGLKESLPF